MTKDFIDELIEVTSLKKSDTKRSKNYQLSKSQNFIVAGVQVEKNYKHTEETLRKISEANKGKIFSEITKKKIGDANRGRVVSEETRKKLSEAGKGRVITHSEETKRKISKALKGKVLTEERKQKMSEAHKGRVVSEETRRKIGEGHKGKVVSEETRRKIGESQKGKVISEEQRKKLSEANKRADHTRPVMTPNGKFISKESLKQRLISDGVKAPSSRIVEWFKLYPNDFYYIKKTKTS